MSPTSWIKGSSTIFKSMSSFYNQNDIDLKS